MSLVRMTSLFRCRDLPAAAVAGCYQIVHVDDQIVTLTTLVVWSVALARTGEVGGSAGPRTLASRVDLQPLAQTRSVGGQEGRGIAAGDPQGSVSPGRGGRPACPGSRRRVTCAGPGPAAPRKRRSHVVANTKPSNNGSCLAEHEAAPVVHRLVDRPDPRAGWLLPGVDLSRRRPWRTEAARTGAGTPTRALIPHPAERARTRG
jgi:hypothetical protein